jgi:hypothetical protein
MYPEYDWASNQVKVLRAKEQLANENKLRLPSDQIEITEDLIKERYAKLGGLVLNVEVEEATVSPEGNIRVVKKTKKTK